MSPYLKFLFSYNSKTGICGIFCDLFHLTLIFSFYIIPIQDYVAYNIQVLFFMIYGKRCILLMDR